jgi:hypothetical protein
MLLERTLMAMVIHLSRSPGIQSTPENPLSAITSPSLASRSLVKEVDAMVSHAQSIRQSSLSTV